MQRQKQCEGVSLREITRGRARRSGRGRGLRPERWQDGHLPEPDIGIQLPCCPRLTLPHDLRVIPEAPILRVVRVVVEHDLLAHLQLLPLEDMSGTGPDIPGTHLDHSILRVAGRESPCSNPRVTLGHIPSTERGAEAEKVIHDTDLGYSHHRSMFRPLSNYLICCCQKFTGTEDMFPLQKCYGLICVPPKRYVDLTLVPGKATLFGNRVFTDVNLITS